MISQSVFSCPILFHFYLKPW